MATSAGSSARLTDWSKSRPRHGALRYQYGGGWSLARDIESLPATVPVVPSGRGGVLSSRLGGFRLAQSGRARTGDWRRVRINGVVVDALCEHQVIDIIVDGALRRRGAWVVSINLDTLRQIRANGAVRELVGDADVFVADGTPVLWASGLQRTPLPRRVAASSFIYGVAGAAAGKGASLFLLGGNPGVAARAAARLQALYPPLEVAGTYCPPMGFEDDEREMAQVCEAVRSARPDIVFVGLGFPKQERVIARLRSALPGASYVGCGIALSFVSGDIPRAPFWAQRLGLEWLHRMAQEPRRLWRRYLVYDLPVALTLFGDAWRSRRRRKHARAENDGSGARSLLP